MAKVPQFNRFIQPQLTQPGAIQSAGGVARGVASVAEEVVRRENNFQDLQERTEIVKRNSQFQNEAFDIVNTTRKEFESDPDKGVRELDTRLRKLSENIAPQQLNVANRERYRQVQEQTISRYGIQQQEWAANQTRTNIQTNINNTANSYLEAARKAGETSDLVTLQNIAEDVTELTSQAAQTFDAAATEQFSENLKTGVVENFTDGMIFNDARKFVADLNAGVFDKILTTDQKKEKKDEAIKHIENLNKQAKFDRQMRFLNGNAAMLDAFNKGELDLNAIDNLIAQQTISPESGDAMRDAVLNTPPVAETKVEVYSDLWSKKQQLVTKKKGKELVSGKDLDDAVRLQTETLQNLSLGNISPAEAKGIIKSLEIAMRNRVGKGASLEDHYEVAFDRFGEVTDSELEQIELFKQYVELADQNNVDGLEGTKFQGFFKDGSVLSFSNKRNDMARQLANQVVGGFLKQRTPGLSTLEELPNNVITQKGDTIYTGAQKNKQRSDSSVQTNFKIMKRSDGSVWRVFPDNTAERIE